MNRKTGPVHAGLRRSVGADDVAQSQACSGGSTRRKLLLALGAGALAVPLASFAQQRKVWRVGFLGLRGRPASIESDFIGAFPRGLRELGYVEGRNLVIEWRFAVGKVERLSSLAEELVQLKVDVIVTGATLAVSAAQKATATIPIVSAGIADPVGSGFAKSLARPGGNITGLSLMLGDISPKLLEMLLSMAPGLSRVAVLSNPSNPAHAAVLKNVRAAAQTAGIKVVLPMEARNPQEIENAFSMMARQNAGAVILAQDPIFIDQARQIAELAAKRRLPSISGFREYAEAGGLMSYGQNLAESFRRTATYVDKIFKGAKPADLPIEQPTTLELVINMKTAKALGIRIPQSILVRADRVIE